ncbi:MAG: PhoH family protein, partial [Pseudomonadota bacterium]|nr:PhoH family protein [Pseudomonadota bacterium]
MSTHSILPADHRVVVPFEDNRLVALLLGEYDANLALIENRLGVHAAARGNVVTLTGPEFACDIARRVLEQLYARLASGETITPGEVDGVIRHMSAPARKAGTIVRDDDEDSGAVRIRTRKRVITARSQMQSAYMKALDKSELIFGTGPAGTGKTYIAVAHAAAALEHGSVDRLILSRPAVEAGERLGFLPGDMRD